MSNQRNNLDDFEAAMIQTGGQVSFVTRRKGPAILDRLTPAERKAVETYATTAEAVMAGGASNPSDMLSAGCSSGAPSREGRQSGFVDQVSFLRLMERAVSDCRVTVTDKDGKATVLRGSFLIGRAGPVAVPTIDLWRKVCLGDLTMAAFLRGLGMAPAKSRMADVNKAFLDAGTRVADAISQTRDPTAG